MKKILFITLLFCGLAFSVQSQSLTYNKVILLTALDTVPQGKVWKVVSVLPNNTWLAASSNSWYSNSLAVSVNDMNVILASTINNPGYRTGYSTNPDLLPIWLPAGTTLEPSTNCGSLSIIEFTENNE
jgi:hypothetical protein